MPIVPLLFEIYLAILILRFLLECFSANDRNIFVMWITKLAKPVIFPLQKILPTHGKVNWACLIGIVLVKLIELLLFIWVNLHTWPHVGGLVIWAGGSLLYLTVQVLFWCVIIQAILSWVAMMHRGLAPLQEVMYYLTNPILQPVQRLIPSLGGIDFSPMLVLLVLGLFNRYISAQIIMAGMALIF